MVEFENMRTGVIGVGWIIRFLANNKKVIPYVKNLKLKIKSCRGCLKTVIPIQLTPQ